MGFLVFSAWDFYLFSCPVDNQPPVTVQLDSMWNPVQLFVRVQNCYYIIIVHKNDTAITFTNAISDFIWIFLPPYKGVIPNPKTVFIFPIL